MASKVEICNSALNMLGANNITDITEDSKNARLLNQRYDPVRDAIFRSHAWNCLIKRVQLAQDTDTPTHEYAKQYTTARTGHGHADTRIRQAIHFASGLLANIKDRRTS